MALARNWAYSLEYLPRKERVVNMKGRIILLFCVLIGVQIKTALNFTLCKQEDSACLTKNDNIMYKLTVQGIPKLNIESLEPIHHDVIDGDLAVLKYRLFNTTVEGSTKCEVVDAKLDLQKTKLNLAMFCPLFHMYGLYEISGKILVMPIEGKGDFKMECKDYYIQVDSDIKISQGQNGKKYISFKSYKTKGDLQGGMIIEIKNLFNGRQKELADDINRFINKNWKPVANELQGPVFNANMRILVKNFNKYLKSIPLDELILGVD